MKIDDLVTKVASDFPIKEEGKIELDEEDEVLHLEQLPQLLSLFLPREVTWKYTSIIIGPDGSQIATRGKNEKPLYFLSPVYDPKPIGWNLKLSTESIKKMIYDLLPCREGESYFNPSFWKREDIVENKKIVMESGEINTKIRENINPELQLYENSLIVDAGYVNPIYTFLNPFFISQAREARGKSEFFSISLKDTYTLAGENKLEIQNELGRIKVISEGKIIMKKTSSWKEAKPYELVWNLKNKIERIDCKTQFPVSLYKIYPSGILPFFINYKENSLVLGLINLNELPVITNLILTARIEEAFILSPQGKEIEKLSPEFDRIRVPIRRFGIIFLKLKIKKLLDSFIKRKIITA